MFFDRKPRVVALALISFALVLSTVQNVSVAHATTLTCAQGGKCIVGDTGPGGGRVFYADTSGFDCGPTLTLKCAYLEYSTSLAGSGIKWSIPLLTGTEIGITARGTAIGTGYKNTLAIINQQGAFNESSNKYEAGAAQAFRGGGKTDWYQPSKDELTELYASLESLSPTQRDLGFVNASTEFNATTTWGIWTPVTGSVITSGINKSDPNITIPIRAFNMAIDGAYNCTTSGTFNVFQAIVISSPTCSGEATIPDGVWSIGNNAFKDNILITKAIFPTSLERISNYAFSGSTSLASITIPDSVTTLGRYAFNGATSVTSISIGAGLTQLGDYSFKGLSGLISLTIPGTVNIIGTETFSGASSLTSIIIPSSVTDLNSNSFAGTSSLLRVQILSLLIAGPVTDKVFSGTTALTCLTNLSNLDRVTELGLPDVPSCSSAPDAPVISTLVGGDRQLRITFTIASDGGAAIDHIQYSIDSGANWIDASGTTSPITISSLTGRTSYTLQIRAHNSVGNSLGSNLKTATTTDSSADTSEAAAAAAAAVNAAIAADAAKRALDQKEMSELLSVIPSIAGLALNIGDLTNSLLAKQKCVKGKTIKYVKKGTKCPKGYAKRK